MEVMSTLSAEQRQYVESVQDVVEAEMRGRAFSWNGETPWANLRALAEADLLCANFAPEYGGQGYGEFEAMLAVEAVGRVCPDTAWFVYTQQMVGPRAIEMFGSEVAKETYLPQIAEGRSHIAIAISEPDAGSDVGSMKTTVSESDDGTLVLNGEKIWVGGVPSSDAAVVWAKFPEGLGSLVLDFDAPGVDIEKHYRNMVNYTQTHFTIDDVEIPEENVLTRGREGFKQQLKALNWERLGSAVVANSWATCALDHALDYAAEREQFGQPIADFQGMEWKFADMLTEIEVSTAIAYREGVRAANAGTPPDRLATSMAKLYSSQMVERVASEAVQTVGARAYQKGHPLEYLFRLVRGRRIAAGTDEIQKNTIARTLKEKGIPSILDR
ncbi:acyl-CoA dehydrogenase family protein [Halomarina ordinaria]|uniref:Acyl-CoA dehydrogenase family protein n=1 Tax=Halomarina ordinaria TaxID=3033939 RepID=A0ABD5UBN3_9EURY|nr:acyl-CoA dehydrogenase family protein [Halomarina sp. PSRA2]